VKLVGDLAWGGAHGGGAAEAQAFMDACDCLCLPSVRHSESFGIVQIEAMRAGKPVISTRLRGSGIDWVNQHGVTGLVIPPRDPGAIAEAITALGSDRALRARLGANGRARYEAQFTARQMTETMEQAYRTLF
jgi:rhamnosyl/mannosyltransferase